MAELKKDLRGYEPGQGRYHVVADDYLVIGEIWMFDGRPMWICGAEAFVFDQGSTMVHVAEKIREKAGCKSVSFQRPARVSI